MGKTGDRGFCADENNTIRYRSGGWNQLHSADSVMLAKAAAAAGAVCCAPLRCLRRDNDAIVRKVDDHYNHLSSLRAHYSEHYSGMGMDRTEEGTLLLKKPGRMRWSYAQPVGKVFVLDGKFAWFYTPGDAQATAGSGEGAG